MEVATAGIEKLKIPWAQKERERGVLGRAVHISP